MEPAFEKATILPTGMDPSTVQGAVPMEVPIQDLLKALPVARYQSKVSLISEKIIVILIVNDLAYLQSLENWEL